MDEEKKYYDVSIRTFSDFYFQGKSKTYRNCMSVITNAVNFLLTALLTYVICFGGDAILNEDFRNGIVLVPAILLAGLYGYFPALISFTVAFLFSLFFSVDTAYCAVVVLYAIVVVSLFSQALFFKTFPKTIFVAGVTTAGVGILDVLCLQVLQNTSLTFSGFFSSAGRFMLLNAPYIFGICILLWLFFTKAPDQAKMVFALALMYTKKYENSRFFQHSMRKTRVSAKITSIIIVVELVLGISVSIFLVILFPDIKLMLVQQANSENQRIEIERQLVSQDDDEDADTDNQLTEETYTEATEHFTQILDSMDYQISNYSLVIDLKMIFLMLCVGVPLAGIASYYVRSKIGNTLGNVSDFMKEFARADEEEKLKLGEIADDITVNSNDEIKIVYDSMHETVHSMTDYIRQIREEQELKTELLAAQKANEAKSEFLANMSHEIRTPINAVLGMNEMILRESKENDIITYAQDIKSAGNALLSLVNDILDFSKIEAGKMEILPVQYHLGSTINDLVNMVQKRVEDKGLSFEVHVDPNIPCILYGDEIRIKQCVTNILTNAVKYTEKGTVDLYVTYQDASDGEISLGFRVVDTGIGMKEEDLAKLYSPFERIEEIRNRTIEGTGLGMSITKKILAMMDTKMEVKSVYGKGSDFSFSVIQQIVSKEPIGDFKEKYRTFLQSKKESREFVLAPEANVLIVDDTEMNLTVMKGLLKRTKIQVDTATSGKETLAMVKKKRYDLLFIDHRMPEMDGIETFEAMKTLDGNQNLGVPTIALTANAVSGAREMYLSHGFSDYLSKPVNAVLLEEMLVKYLPKEKVQLERQTDAERNDETAEIAIPKESFLHDLKEVDLHAAVKNCGSVEILENVVKEFLASIDTKADAIENYLKEDDLKNYTVLVHALKSSARLIGAMKLSEMAAELEDLGNRKQKRELLEKTPELLALYREYQTYLAPAQETKEKQEEISEEELIGALKDIKEVVEAYDFDTADSIMEMLENYQIPEAYEEKYQKLKELLLAVDQEGILELLK